jgi:H+-transporting ATPase
MDDTITPQFPIKDVPLLTGLTGDEARRRLEEFGPNSVPETTLHPLARALANFWAPIPWMLEAAVVLELSLGKFIEGAIIAVLLVFNAVLGFFQEGRAQKTLAALKSRLALNASVRRNSTKRKEE